LLRWLQVTKRRMNEIREKPSEELEKELTELTTELRQMRTKVAAGGQITKPSRIREVRKRAARIKTVLRERELGLDVSRSGG